MQNTTSLILGCLLALTNLTAIIIYFQKARIGSSTPNAASWMIWFGVSLVNLFTYQFGTGDWVKSINAYVATGNCFFMFSFCLFRGRMKEIRKLDSMAIYIALVALVCWYVSGVAWYGNVFIQFAVAISFAATFIGVIKGTHHEHALPWLLWTICHGLTLCIVLLRWDNQPISLLYPILGICLNATITVTASIKNQQIKIAR
ncbi:MAG: hypothetical protein WCT08_05445 [Patescibacteria group bacterium]|jgi:hypothetical protein